MKAIYFILLTPFLLIYSLYLHYEFESTFYFSHLSDDERELTFRSEMAFYISYYKQLLSNGLSFSALLNDTHTEYPLEINSLKRFNIYPELVIANLYHLFAIPLFKDRQCYSITRALNEATTYAVASDHKQVKDLYNTKYINLAPLPNVISCVGNSDPYWFYINLVFILYSLVPLSIFLTVYLLSRDLTASFIAIGVFLNFHQDATRIHHTPSLRESFAYPFFLLQQCLLVYIIKSPKRVTFRAYTLLLLSQVAFQLPWQFSQFALTTQLLAIWLTYLFDWFFEASQIRDGTSKPKRLLCLILVHVTSLVISYAMQFFNELIISSVYLPVIIAVFLTTLIWIYNLTRPLLVNLLLLALNFFLVLSLIVKSQSSQFEYDNPSDGGHILDILKVKLFPKRFNHTFHTLLYTCQAEFDFFPPKVAQRIFTSPLMSMSVVSVLLMVYRVLQKATFQITDRISPVEMFMFLQFIAFTIMGVLIMRLRLFWITHAIIMSGIVFRTDFMATSRKGFYLKVLIFGVVASSAYLQISTRLSRSNDFSDYDTELAMNWLRNIPQKDSNRPWVLTGPMTLMSTARLMLIADKPEKKFSLTNHPHYENAEIRHRTILAYSMYSRANLSEIYNIYHNQLHTDFLLVTMNLCSEASRLCSMPHLYSLVRKSDGQIYNTDKESVLCTLLNYQPTSIINEKLHPFFRIVYRAKSNSLVILQVL